MSIPIALSIAGSDPSGGAGIQADLKTFAAFEVYGATVISALTAQNTFGVQAVHDLPPDFVLAQLDAILADLPPAAIKIGMLGGGAKIAPLAARLAGHPRIVLDPILRASDATPLLDAAARAALAAELVPIAALLTPNLPEAAELLGETPARIAADPAAACARLLELGPGAVLLKGGHSPGPECRDLLLEPGAEPYALTSERIETPSTHGTGCTLSSAITALLARGEPLRSAVERAKVYLSAALRAGAALGVGHGRGPLHHLHALRSTASSPQPPDPSRPD